jgi:hypothetical protein
MLAWIAKDKGYFRAHELDIQFAEVQNPSLLPGLVGKQFDIVPSNAAGFDQSIRFGAGRHRYLRRDD